MARQTLEAVADGLHQLKFGMANAHLLGTPQSVIDSGFAVSEGKAVRRKTCINETVS